MTITFLRGITITDVSSTYNLLNNVHRRKISSRINGAIYDEKNSRNFVLKGSEIINNGQGVEYFKFCQFCLEIECETEIVFPFLKM